MAPGNSERQPGHTGTIPKTKPRNNCNVPQEAVTPTRRDIATNLVSTSLDWVPVSEYNSRGNYHQSRKQTNNTSDHELTDLDNSVTYESGYGRFVPVRPQPRALPLNVQNQNITSDTHDDGAGSSASGHSMHPYVHQIQNGLNAHSNHAAAAVMIVNPTTPNALTGNMSQPFNASNQNRNNLTRNLNSARNNFDSNSHSSNNNTTPPVSSSRTTTKTVNIMNNMYDQAQGTFSNVNDNNHVRRDSARALGEAIVAACPDAAAVERRLGQIREYIRVTSSLVDTMRNSEDEAYIEHTKEEYDELVEMVMKLKESEKKLMTMLVDDKGPDNVEVLEEEPEQAVVQQEPTSVSENISETEQNITPEKACNIKSDTASSSNSLKKVTNLENEQLNKSLHKLDEAQKPVDNSIPVEELSIATEEESQHVNKELVEPEDTETNIVELATLPCSVECAKDDLLNEVLRKNIISCVEKVALIEDIKNKKKDANSNIDQDVVVRPVSAQSNGSAYSESELWQNEIKNKMEISQMRLTALKQQQRRLLKYQEEAKHQLEEMNRERQMQNQDMRPSSSHDNFVNGPSQTYSANYQHPNRMYTANQIGVATTLPHSDDNLHGQQNISSNVENERGHSAHSTHSQDDRFSHRAANVASSEEAVGGPRDSDAEDEDESILSERARLLQMKLRELQLKKQHMENLVTEFQKLQMSTNQVSSSRNTYSSSGEDSGVEESTRKFLGNTPNGNIKNEDPFKLMEIKAIKAALQKTKDLMRSVENYESEHLTHVADESFHAPSHSNIHENKSEGTSSIGGWSNEGSVCRVRNSLPQRQKFTNEEHSQQYQQQQHQQQQHQQQHHQQQHRHEANIATLQELAQELRMETEKIMGERARIKDMVSNKEGSRKHKKVNEEASGSGGCGPGPGPAERRQMQLRALLQDKQRELEALLNKEKVLCTAPDSQNPDLRQSYTSEQDEPDSRSEQILLDSQNSHENETYRARGDSVLGTRSLNTMSTHLGSAFGSDSDSASRNKSNQRNRVRRRQPHDRQADDVNTSQQNNANQNMRRESRGETSNVNMVPTTSQNDSPANLPYPPMPQSCWNNSKTNQDMRNQFTQNSHSQTMERLLGTPQVSFPPFNMMMPFGMVGGCGCGCGVWGAWCWQQLLLQQQEINQLREQLAHLERWRTDNASHTLNNQVPPGNRANNYWDNFRSYSRQNLLSGTNKTNADGQQSSASALSERSYNPLQPPHPPPHPGHPAQLPQPPHSPHAPHSVPHCHHEVAAAAAADHPRHQDTNTKRKSSSKLPAKNSSNRRNCALDYAPTSNIDIASASDFTNPNLASTGREVHDKSTSKLFDLLRENVYSEVTTLIGANESHPDFLIQLFRELQPVSSEPLRRRVLQSIRGALSQAEAAPPASAPADDDDDNCAPPDDPALADHEIDGHIDPEIMSRSEETGAPELLEALAAAIVRLAEPVASPQLGVRIRDVVGKYEGARASDAADDVASALEAPPAPPSGPTLPRLQDVAAALDVCDAPPPPPPAPACGYELWAAGPGAGDGGDLTEADRAQAAPPAPHHLSDDPPAAAAEAEAEWLGLDCVPTRLHMGDPPEKQKD